ncbi:MAG: hypothetical protein CM15mP74_11130 [Halieaceae bacterium]|nr:MAG: hypothetical protein CM15mP74_11130 [Halieaceae bacterium]
MMLPTGTKKTLIGFTIVSGNIQVRGYRATRIVSRHVKLFTITEALINDIVSSSAIS